ncbi:MAG TPA: DtxR family transcriptional regulator [Planctomycetota bacterium]|nr:DtxR family transcriptional regulator [Planctomycetota bacterium]
MPDNITPALEDYLEAILHLTAKKGAARVRDIAAMLSVHKSTVTSALRRLAGENLVTYAPYELTTLTPAGSELARVIAERHAVICRFLSEILLLNDRLAESNACRMEHVLDSQVLERLFLFASFVRECPRAGNDWLQRFHFYIEHGKPPGADAEWQRWLEKRMKKHHLGNENGGAIPLTLNQLPVGQSARIVSISGGGALKRRLTDMGAVHGTLVQVLRIAPLGDPLEVKIKGYNLSLRKEEAAAIRVEVTGA